MGELGGYGPTIIATLWAETLLALVFVCMRLWTRIRINKTVGWDDYLISLSWLMLIPYAAATTISALKGLGRHATDLTLDQFFEVTRIEIIGQTFGIIGVATSKASVAVFLLRITIIRWHRWVLYIVMLCVSTSCFFCALFDYIRCDPVSHIWNPTIPARCWMTIDQFTSLSLSVGVISATADFVLAILPWHILWGLQMKKKDKIFIASSMSLGLFAGVCGVIRTYSLEAIMAGADYSYETVRLILWSSTEMTVTILTATIPTLHPLYKRVFGITSPSQDATPSYKLPDRPPPNDPFYFSPYDNNSQTLVVAGQRNADERSLKSNLSRRDIICTDVVDVEYEQRSDPHTLNHWITKERSQDWDMV